MYEQGDEKIIRTTKYSSLLFWPDEEEHGVHKDHSNMVKFSTQQDDTYKTVVRVLHECLEKITGEAE